jgi:hypothetical protein
MRPSDSLSFVFDSYRVGLLVCFSFNYELNAEIMNPLCVLRIPEMGGWSYVRHLLPKN